MAGLKFRLDLAQGKRRRWRCIGPLCFGLKATRLLRAREMTRRAIKGPQRRIKRWEDENVVDAVQARLDRNPDAMRTRRETVEHPFGTLKMRMGATHFLMKTLPKVATEMALHVLAYNLTRVMNIVGIKPFLAAIRA
jgi:hypothetical protein